MRDAINELVKLSAAVIGEEKQQTVNANDLWIAKTTRLTILSIADLQLKKII